MSVAISIQFLTGRYHATPWDKQVNEGAVEWPPSPWRILRSLVSAYYRLLARPERSVMLALMSQLAEQPPSYVLPAYTSAHTRHFMPLWKEGKATTTKVLDTFYALPGGAFSGEAIVQVMWADVDLQQVDLQLLQSLCERVSYLGRAESWVEMMVTDGANLVPNAVPIAVESQARRDEAVTKVLMPLSSAGMRTFVAAIDVFPQPKKGRGSWTAPQDVLEALETDVGKLHSQGWHGIPGSQWVLYGLKPQRVIAKVERKSLAGVPAIARFALSAKVLPRLTAALSVGERFHQALMAWSRDAEGRTDRVFAGRDGDGEPLESNHDHAWYLPECNDRGEITHVLVYAKAGFNENALRALRGLEKVWGSEGFDIWTDLVSVGAMGAGAEPSGGRLRVTGQGNLWRSLTPFMLTRFPKRDRRGNAKLIAGTAFQVDGPEDQALRLLRQARSDWEWGEGQKLTIEDVGGDWLVWLNDVDRFAVRVRCVACGILDQGRDEQRYPWQRFQRSRLHGRGAKSLGQGFWLEVQFDSEPIVGPIALGYGAHFGLGVLVPCADG
jgi:CRISPR-associated protein Csb2